MTNTSTDEGKRIMGLYTLHVKWGKSKKTRSLSRFESRQVLTSWVRDKSGNLRAHSPEMEYTSCDDMVRRERTCHQCHQGPNEARISST